MIAQKVDRVIVGRVVGPWGLQGQVRVEVLSDNRSRFARGSTLWVAGEQRSILEVHARRSNQLVLRLSGIHSIEEAESLRNAVIEVPISDVSSLPEGEFYFFQIIGLAVYTQEGEFLGRVTEILRTGSNDVYVVGDRARPVLIPAIEDVVKEIDLERERILIEPLPGLLDRP
jgi:16S rRNA processing protein RimM